MNRYMKTGAAIALIAVVTAGATWVPRWGYRGHELTGYAAATNLPKAMPEFFREARKQLEYLNPEPDRWRLPDSIAQEMNRAFSNDHYVDLEVLSPYVLEARDRWEYLKRAQASGVKDARDAGFVQYRILELYQRLEREFGLWRVERNKDRRELIEERILNDAGLLGHYVADAANPHHTTVHHDRWAAGYPNPNNYTTERGFHSRFESVFVENNIRNSDVLPLVRREPREISDVRAGVMQYIQTSHALVPRLYDLDKQQAFTADNKSEVHKAFAVGRLVAGADMLRDLWWTAWVHSAETAKGTN
ncbi:MAG TPA: hypothetical protein VF035_07475 [Longimicrobiales bacterium]